MRDSRLRTGGTIIATMYDEELDETMLPPRVTRITDRSNHKNLSLNQTANMNRLYPERRGVEAVEYEIITRPAATSTAKATPGATEPGQE